MGKKIGSKIRCEYVCIKTTNYFTFGEKYSCGFKKKKTNKQFSVSNTRELPKRTRANITFFLEYSSLLLIKK